MEGVVGVEQWAEIRRMHSWSGSRLRRSIASAAASRDDPARAWCDEPPRYRRAARPSKLDPFRDVIEDLLRADPPLPGKRMRELVEELGYLGAKTIFDDYLRELRPRFLPRRTYQRTVYRPGELFQFDLFEPREPVPVGHGQTRRGWVVTAELGWSRALAGALVFSKQAPDLLLGMSRCLGRLGALPERLVWDREAAIHAGGGRPTEEFAGFCGQLAVGWLILEPADPEAKGRWSAPTALCAPTSSPAGASLGARLPARSTPGQDGPTPAPTAPPAPFPPNGLKRSGKMRALRERMPETDRGFVVRVAQQPYLRFDPDDTRSTRGWRCRSVEVRVSQRELVAVALDTGELAARNRRSFAAG